MIDLVSGLIPDARLAIVVGSLAAVVGLVAAACVGVLRKAGVRVAYTRKLYHIAVFTSAAGVHAWWGLPGTLTFGGVIAGLVLAAVFLGDGNPFYEALARDSDRPHRTMFVLIPLLTTAVGGLAAALLTGPFASVGYLAAGWGDAVGEPVGARWGRHPFRVPSLGGVPATRTLEGSTAVFLVATVGSVVALVSLGHGSAVWWAGPLCGLTAAIVEAVSHHGLDNLTVQLVPSLVAFGLFG